MAGSESGEPEHGHGGATKRSFDELREEDAATMKAGEDLKRASIQDTEEDKQDEKKLKSEVSQHLQDEAPKTPTLPQNADQVTSPKKKRSREDAEGDAADQKNDSVSSDGSANGDRAERQEPEKKRVRDEAETTEDVAASDKVMLSLFLFYD